MVSMAVTADAMSYEQARREALFLTDKMAYELNLNQEQYDAAYEINLDYLMGVTTVDDVYSDYWTRRNLDMSYILYDWQWNAFRAASYFYRPLYWRAGCWHFGVYARYPRRTFYYFDRPSIYVTYRGGHSWRSNGGRSFYHGRRNQFVKAPDSHFGMRDRWDRGDFNSVRNNGRGSSTRVTVNKSNGFNSGRTNSSVNNRNNGFGTARSSGSFGSQRSSISTSKPTNRFQTTSSQNGAKFGSSQIKSMPESKGSLKVLPSSRSNSTGGFKVQNNSTPTPRINSSSRSGSFSTPSSSKSGSFSKPSSSSRGNSGSFGGSKSNSQGGFGSRR